MLDRHSLTFLAPLALLAGAVLTSACVVRDTLHGSGVAASESRELPAFHHVELAGSVDATISVGPGTSVVVSIDDNLLPNVITRVRNGVLTIRLDDDNNYRHEHPLTVAIATPQLDGVSIAGCGDIRASGVRSEHFDASIAGSGEIHIEGAASALDISIAGAGTVDASQLATRRTSVSITGSGTVRVDTSEDLDVSIAGSGDVSYIGGPNVSRSIVGSGSVTPSGDGDA